MTKCWKLFLLISGALFGCLSISGQNVITNGNFENGLNSWSIDTSKEHFNATFSIYNHDDEEINPSLKVEVNLVDDIYWAFRFHHINLKQKGLSVNRYDVFKLSCRVKGIGNRLLIQAGLTGENTGNTDFYDLADYAMVNIPLSSEWQYHEIKLIASETASDMNFVLRFGEKTGTYFIDNVKLERIAEYKDKQWMQRVDERIDSIRKADFRIQVVDETNHPVSNAEIKVQLSSHEFMWGTSVIWTKPGTWNKKRWQWERKEILKTFNTIVNEDDFKWPQMEPKQGKVNHRNVNLYVNWARENHLRMRGHCLVWPKQGVFLPKWFEALPPHEAKTALKTRITREMNYYQGKMQEYDVVNEPVHNPFLADWLGDTIYHDIYSWARNADPGAELYVNEWWNFDYWDHYRFKRHVDTLLAQGTPLDGLGLQGHMDREFNWLQFKFKLDYLAGSGLPIKITEFDINVDELELTLEEQARYYSDMMHLAFSHPAMNGFLIWGLTDGWRDNAGIYHDDFTPRPAAKMMHHLIKEKWHTEERGTSNSDGIFRFHGFKGAYNITVTKGDKEKKYRISLKDLNHVRHLKF